MKTIHAALLCLAGTVTAANVAAQSVTLTWPLNNTTQMTGSSSPATLATANTEILSGNGGGGYVLSVWDYWTSNTPNAQRLYGGTTGWLATPESPTRFIQFDASPTPGNQLTVNNVSFNYGGNNVASQVQANVYYSVDNWSTRVPLNTSGPLTYALHTMLPFTKAFTAPAVAAPNKFSLRIYPFAILPSNAGAPTFAAHSQVVINGNSSPVGGKTTEVRIRKITQGGVIPGTYVFNVTCSGPGGPYTGGPVSVVLPNGPVASINVPTGDTCQLTEVMPTFGSWNPPTYAFSGVNGAGTSAWSAQIGPVLSTGGVVMVTNNPKKDDKQAKFDIRKSTGDKPIAGTYQFNITCHMPDGTPTPATPGTLSVTLPTPGFGSVSVATGAICLVAEVPPPGSWGVPGYSGTGIGVVNNGWEAKVGPVTGSSGVVNVANKPGQAR
jgi:hypothetical protein